jgi:hypothetical protein
LWTGTGPLLTTMAGQLAAEGRSLHDPTAYADRWRHTGPPITTVAAAADDPA